MSKCVLGIEQHKNLVEGPPVHVWDSPMVASGRGFSHTTHLASSGGAGLAQAAAHRGEGKGLRSREG